MTPEVSGFDRDRGQDFRGFSVYVYGMVNANCAEVMVTRLAVCVTRMGETRGASDRHPKTP